MVFTNVFDYYYCGLCHFKIWQYRFMVTGQGRMISREESSTGNGTAGGGLTLRRRVGFFRAGFYVLA